MRPARSRPDHKAGDTVHVRVTPKASRNAVQKDADGNFRIYVTTVPEDGKANAAVLKLLSRTLGIPKSRLEIIRGHRARDKVILVKD